MTIRINAKAILWILLAINVAFFVLYLATYYSPLRGSTTAIEFLDVDAESNPPTWYGGSLWLVMALPALLRGLQLRQQDRKSPWKLYLLGALIAVFLSMDEIGMVHERINNYFGGSFKHIKMPTNNTTLASALSILIYGAIGIVLLLVLLKDIIAFLRDRRGLIPIIAGAAIFFIGAGIVDNLMPDQRKEIGHAFEELFEMCGTTLMIYGFLLKLDRVTLEVGQEPVQQRGFEVSTRQAP